MPFKSMPDLSTLKPMRLLAACEDENGEKRKNLTHQLYHALWAEKKGLLKTLLPCFLQQI